jgi:hypothetical protein
LKTLTPACFLTICLLSAFSLFGQNPEKVRNLVNHKDWSFVENKGQLKDEMGNLLPDIQYYGHHGGVNLYCKPGMISFVFTKMDSAENADSKVTRMVNHNAEDLLQPSGCSTARADFLFINSNPNARIIAADQQSYYENYYTTGDANHGITGVRAFKVLTYKDLYPKIDMVLKVSGEGIEYSFLVHPGGEVSDIKMSWRGMKSEPIIDNAGFRYINSIGYINETAPLSFVNGKKIKSGYKTMGTEHGFEVENYDKSRELIIDPLLVWATYHGGTDGDQGLGVACDAKGNVFITGRTSSPGMATSGAFKTSVTGYYDAFLAKYNNSGSLQWATYFGNGVYNSGLGVCTDTAGNVFITGETDGTGNGMATSGAYQTSRGGNDDAFLAKFSNTGSLVWSTYFGGLDYDEALAVCTDISGNVYMTGSTTNSNLATSGAYKTSVTGSSDVFIAKFKNSGNLDWATYYGGSSYDIAYGINADNFGNVYITGETASSSGIATSGAFQPSFSGTGYPDAFLAKFTVSGSFKWGTYCGTSVAYYEAGLGVATDRSGNVYMAGYTYSGGLASSGAFQTTVGGYCDAYLAKFNSSGGRIWATYYGGSGSDACNGVCTDAAENVYLTGYTYASSSGIATAGAYQTANVGSSDGFLVKFNSAGNRIWGTYFGYDDEDEADGVAADKYGNVYIVGETCSKSHIATSGAYQTTWKGSSGHYSGFLAKFSFLYQNEAGVDSVINPVSTICAGAQPVKIRFHNFGAKTLTSATIGWSVNSVVQTSYKWSGSLSSLSSDTLTIGILNFTAGTKTIKVWTSKPNGQNDSVTTNDTAKITFAVNPLPSVSITGPAPVCAGNNVQFTINVSNVASGQTWIINYRKDGNSADSFITGTGSGQFYLSTPILITSTAYNFLEIIETSGNTQCSNTISFKVSVVVHQIPAAFFTTAKSVCPGGQSQIGISVSNIDSGQAWTIEYNKTGSNTDSFFTGTGSGLFALITAPLSSSRNYSLVNITSTSGTICSNTLADKKTVIVNPLPYANAGLPGSICYSDSVLIGAGSTPDYVYNWSSNPTGFKSNASNPKVSPVTTTTYSLLVVNSLTGCQSKDSVKISVNPLPKPDPGPAQSICFGENAVIGGNLVIGNSYSWISKPAGFNSTLSSQKVKPDTTTTYYVTEKINSTGCRHTDSVVVTVNPLPVPAVGLSKSICYGESTLIGSSSLNGHTYSWTSGSSGFTSTSSNPAVNPVTTTFYKLKETIKATGCSATDSVKITVNPLPDPKWYVNNFGKTTYFHATDSSLMNPAYHWDFGDGDKDSAAGHLAKHLYPKNKDYKVKLKVENSFGCINEYDSTINIEVSGISIIPADNLNLSIFPNPFSDGTTIRYSLIKAASVRISISDITGKEIAIITDRLKAAGDHHDEINAESCFIRPGIYTVKIEVDNVLFSRQLIKF